MIKTKTVLVLGAGASIPLNFPDASKLRHEVIDLTGKAIASELFEMGFTLQEMKLFSKDLTDSSVSSVDEFLVRRKDPRYRMLGKAAMAFCLIRREEPLSVSAIKYESENWYRELLKAMDCPFEQIKDNQLSVVTFNYERSLEHFLFTAFNGKYERTPEECLEAVSKIRIIHIHGKLGEYPTEEYNPDLNHRDLASCAEQIKIPPDLPSNPGDAPVSPAYAEAIEELKTAERIYFIGFGYHRLNLKRLRLHKIMEYRQWLVEHQHIPSAQQDIRGTGFHLGPKEVQRISTDWPMIKLAGFHETAMKFLQNMVALDD